MRAFLEASWKTAGPTGVMSTERFPTNMMRSKLRAAIVLAIALEVIVPTAKAETIECRERPETREYWSWREIDGRRCWYKGHRSISKKLLSWGPQTPAEGIALDPTTAPNLPQVSPGRLSGSPGEPVEVREHPEALVSSIGPFETAWRNLMAEYEVSGSTKNGTDNCCRTGACQLSYPAAREPRLASNRSPD